MHQNLLNLTWTLFEDCQVNDDASGVTQRSVILTGSMTKQRRNDITLDFKPDPAAKGDVIIANPFKS